MKSIFTWLATALILPFIIATAQAADYEAGVHYKIINPKLPTSTANKIEVAEFFWYGCPHCNQFEPYLNRWKAKLAKDVEFLRIPGTFRPEWDVHARAYYAAESMGVLDKTHAATFSAMHDQRRALNTPEEIASFYAELGVDRKQFEQATRSFSTNSKLSRAKELVRRSGIEGVPAIMVNGKYRIDAQSAGGYANMLKVADFLVEKERKTK